MNSLRDELMAQGFSRRQIRVNGLDNPAMSLDARLILINEVRREHARKPNHAGNKHYARFLESEQGQP